MEVFYQKPASWTVLKYRSTKVYTSSYIKHRTVQCEVRIMASVSESGSTSRVAHSFGSGKLYTCLSNKCFKVYPVYSLCTDVRPSQDHRILHMQMVRINLAIWTSDILYYACIMIFEFSVNRSFWHRCQNCIREKKFSKNVPLTGLEPSTLGLTVLLTSCLSCLTPVLDSIAEKTYWFVILSIVILNI